MELLSKLSETPIPNVMVIAGIVFLLLAVAGKVGANLSVPPNRQKVSALIGTILLASGLIIFLAPSSSEPPESQIQDEEQQVINNRLSRSYQSDQDRGAADSTSHYLTKESIEQAIINAVYQDIQAKRYHDTESLEKYYEGELLRSVLADIEHCRKNLKMFQSCRVDREIHNIVIDKDKYQSTVDMSETWSCANYDIEDGACLSQDVYTKPIRQKVYMNLRANGWMISTVVFDDSDLEVDYVVCDDSWPAKQIYKY